MELRGEISLSKKNAKQFKVFPSFFAPALNALYELHTEKGFRKPSLSTWCEEASLDFQRDVLKVSVQYVWPNFVEVRVSRAGQPRNKHFVLYEKFSGVSKENLMALAKPLYEYLLKVSEQIHEEIARDE